MDIDNFTSESFRYIRDIVADGYFGTPYGASVDKFQLLRIIKDNNIKELYWIKSESFFEDYFALQLLSVYFYNGIRKEVYFSEKLFTDPIDKIKYRLYEPILNELFHLIFERIIEHYRRRGYVEKN